MRMRLGALLAAVTGLVAQAQFATAGNCGTANYSSCPQPVCDAQVSFPSCQQQGQHGYRLVYDNVMETRYRTTYQTVQETVMKQVCKTCYREEPRTTFKTCKETCYKDVHCPVTKKVPVTCYKDVPTTICRPVTVQKTQTVKAQVAKQICEQGVRTIDDPVCKTVQKTCYRDVGCAQVTRPGCETVYKDVCTTCYKDVVETQYRCEKRKVCKPVTYMKSVTHKCNEWVDETYTVPGKKIRCKEEVRDVTVDPCASSCNGCDDGRKCGHWRTCRSWCYETPCETKCRKVCKPRTWCEQVECTKMVKETVCEKVPYQVCKRVPVTTTQKVACTVNRNATGAWVDDKGVGHETEAPGRTWKDCATYQKKVPYTVCR